MDGYICIGQLGKSHGVRGTVSVHPMTDFPERFRSTDLVYVAHEGALPVSYVVLRARVTVGRILLDLEDVTSREAAKELTNAFVYVQKEDVVPLGNDAYYFFQLIGCTVLNTATDTKIGVVLDGERLPANDVLKVALVEGGCVYIPFIAHVIDFVDIKAKIVKIHVLKGLL